MGQFFRRYPDSGGYIIVSAVGFNKEMTRAIVYTGSSCIRDAMKKLGPATAAEIADQIKDKLKTKQEPQRVVAFYLAAWKKLDLVKTA